MANSPDTENTRSTGVIVSINPNSSQKKYFVLILIAVGLLIGILVAKDSILNYLGLPNSLSVIFRQFKKIFTKDASPWKDAVLPDGTSGIGNRPPAGLPDINETTFNFPFYANSQITGYLENKTTEALQYRITYFTPDDLSIAMNYYKDKLELLNWNITNAVSVSENEAEWSFSKGLDTGKIAFRRRIEKQGTTIALSLDLAVSKSSQ